MRRKQQSLVLLVMLLFSIASLNASDKAKGPRIHFAETSYDFGTVSQGTPVKHVFKFKNIGTDTLKIHNVRTSCGCTAAESSKVVAPDQEGEISVEFNTSGRSGQASKRIYVISNDVEKSRRDLQIFGNIAAKKDNNKSEERSK